jgi:hypothetical protein
MIGAGAWAKILGHDWNEDGGVDFIVVYGVGPNYTGTAVAYLQLDDTIKVEGKNLEGVNLSDRQVGLVHNAVQEFSQQHDLKDTGNDTF